MLYNRLKSINELILLSVLLISVHAAASEKRLSNSQLSTIVETECEDENWEIVTDLSNSQDFDEVDTIDQMRAKSLDFSEAFLEHDAQEHNQDLNLNKTHYDEVVSQLKAREWTAILKTTTQE